MAESSQNPGRKWRQLENNGDGDKYFNNYRYTPFTTDTEFFRDPHIYEADEVPRVTQNERERERIENDPRPRGDRRPDERILEEIRQLVDGHPQLDAHQIQVDVQAGVVTLSGNVTSRQEKQIAGGIVGNVLGVLQVNNRLNISKQGR